MDNSRYLISCFMKTDLSTEIKFLITIIIKMKNGIEVIKANAELETAIANGTKLKYKKLCFLELKKQNTKYKCIKIQRYIRF